MVRIGDEGRMILCGPTVETTRIIDIANKLGKPLEWVLSVKDGNEKEVEPDRYYSSEDAAKAARIHLWKEIEHMQAEASRVGKQSGAVVALVPTLIRVSGSLCDIGCPFYQPGETKDLPWTCELFEIAILEHRRCGQCRKLEVR